MTKHNKTNEKDIHFSLFVFKKHKKRFGFRTNQRKNGNSLVNYTGKKAI